MKLFKDLLLGGKSNSGEKSREEEFIMEKKVKISETPKHIKLSSQSKIIKNFCTQNYSTIAKQNYNRILMFVKVLNLEPINITLLRSLAFRGIPEECKGLRTLVWNILLGYLGDRPSKWDEEMEHKYTTFNAFKKEFIINPQFSADSAPIPDGKDNILEETKLEKEIDHPLSLGRKSKWNTFFKDKELWEEIEKDVKRTRSEMSFLMSATDPTKNIHQDILFAQAEKRKSELKAEDYEHYIETHADVISRILFIYGKLNPGISYIQGMNELLAILYYCFYRNPIPHPRQINYLESQTFFCFANLMSELRDNFLRAMDKSESGMKGRLQNISDLLKRLDFPVWDKIREERIEYEFFAFRWQMLLLSQEFDVPDTLRLWDSLLGDGARFNFFYYVCVAIVLTSRELILEGDFPKVMHALQGAPQKTDIQSLLAYATELLFVDQANQSEDDEQIQQIRKTDLIEEMELT